MVLGAFIYSQFNFYQNESPINVNEAKKMVKNGFESAVGNQSTCDVLTSLFGISVPMNRVKYLQNVGDVALVFKLKGRPEEGKILTVEEIEQIGYEFGSLEKLS